jgi:hypothetical protein
VHAAVRDGPPCNCRSKCSDIVLPEECVKIQNAFYSLPDFTSQRYFRGTCVKAFDKKHVYTEKGVSHRRVTYEYSIIVQEFIKESVSKRCVAFWALSHVE